MLSLRPSPAWVILLGLLGSCLAQPALSKSSAAPSWSVRWQPPRVVNGAPVALRVHPPSRLERLSGTWLAHDISFRLDASSGLWYGLAGASLETRPGSYPLILHGITKDGHDVQFRKDIATRAAKYPSISVKVATKFTAPDPEQLKQIAADKTVKAEAFAHSTPEPEWSGNFLPPVQAQVSDVFGTRRVFNGKTQSMHQGLDYAVGQGTPVEAINGGKVILARALYFEGNCVVIDHGQGLLSLYMHLSQFTVKEGDEVKRGQPLGQSGGTGRATGPHLHIAVRWQGIYLDPATLLTLRFP